MDQLRDAVMQWYLQMDFSQGLGFWGRLGPSTVAVDGTCNPGIGIFGNILSACQGASTHDSEGMLATRPMASVSSGCTVPGPEYLSWVISIWHFMISKSPDHLAHVLYRSQLYLGIQAHNQHLLWDE